MGSHGDEGPRGFEKFEEGVVGFCLVQRADHGWPSAFVLGCIRLATSAIVPLLCLAENGGCSGTAALRLRLSTPSLGLGPTKLGDSALLQVVLVLVTLRGAQSKPACDTRRVPCSLSTIGREGGAVLNISSIV